MKQKEINKVEIRNLQKEDYPKDKSSRLSMIKSWAVPSLSS